MPTTPQPLTNIEILNENLNTNITIEKVVKDNKGFKELAEEQMKKAEKEPTGLTKKMEDRLIQKAKVAGINAAAAKLEQKE